MNRLTVERVREMLKYASKGPWDLDSASSVLRSDDGLGICRFDFEDENGKKVFPLFMDEDVPLIEAAPDLARMVLEQAEELARSPVRIGHAGPMSGPASEFLPIDELCPHLTQMGGLIYWQQIMNMASGQVRAIPTLSIGRGKKQIQQVVYFCPACGAATFRTVKVSDSGTVPQ